MSDLTVYSTYLSHNGYYKSPPTHSLVTPSPPRDTSDFRCLGKYHVSTKEGPVPAQCPSRGIPRPDRRERDIDNQPRAYCDAHASQKHESYVQMAICIGSIDDNKRLVRRRVPKERYPEFYSPLAWLKDLEQLSTEVETFPETEDCPVCYNLTYSMRKLTCGHIICEGCILRWANGTCHNNLKCSMCRASILTKERVRSIEDARRYHCDQTGDISHMYQNQFDKEDVFEKYHAERVRLGMTWLEEEVPEEPVDEGGEEYRPFEGLVEFWAQEVDEEVWEEDRYEEGQYEDEQPQGELSDDNWW